ncbi:MAG TPA: Gfo/Idh/MocA family oxidoreductase [Verrucomicrobiota bacterium]|nr:gfo/Idh/MocA family oxidoreductase [Verrucomicrobiales bacterium]HRI11743.1 Gfo/Idh/MocA family oxidoreductase [Verrucomicrobiota bacterium]
MIHTGIIGFGKMGHIRAQAVRESGQGDVLAVYDPTPGTAPAGATFAESPEHILGDPRLDAVFICTPNYMNKPLTIAGLQAGKHIFCEKPPAFTAADVEEIRAVERSSGRLLRYGFNHRYHASIQRIKQIVDSKEMGRILWMRGRYGKEVDASFFKGWRATRELAGGGIMLDQGIHMLDLFLFLGGDFDEVQAMVSNLYWKIDGIEDNVFANFRSSRSGICASLHSTMTQWRYLFSLEVFLEQGAIILNGLKTSSGAYGDEDLAIKRTRQKTHQGTFDAEERITYHTDTSWGTEVMSFLEGITTGSDKMQSSSEALKVMTLIDRIYGK